MPKNVTTEPGGASPNVLAELTDFDLDRKIAAQNQMIESAIAGHDRAIKEVEKCEKSAVLSAWRLGQSLTEKKTRLPHGEWLPWLDSCGISASRASDCMRIACQIASAGNLKPSIRATLRALPTPKSKPAPAVVEPEPVEPPEPDSAAVINDLEGELYDAQERVAIMEESTDPKSRKPIDTINNQRELIKTLKASVADWQGKASSARKENGALKRKIAGLEKQIRAMQ